MMECRARAWLDGLTTPAAVFRPESEMQRESSVEQRGLLTPAVVEFFVIEEGVHGSSMLLDEHAVRRANRPRRDRGQKHRFPLAPANRVGWRLSLVKRPRGGLP